MFQFPWSPPQTAPPCGDLVRGKPVLSGLGCPIRESAGKFTSNKPQLIAASRALHRLLTPRHPPCALVSFSHVKSAKLKYTFYSVLKVLAPLAFTASPWPAIRTGGRGQRAKKKARSINQAQTPWSIPSSTSSVDQLGLLHTHHPLTSKRRSFGGAAGIRTPVVPPCKGGAIPLGDRPSHAPWWPAALWWAFLGSNQRPQSYQDCALNQLS